MKRSEVIEELSRLVALEIDALQAYDAAIAWVGGPVTAIGSELAVFKVEHQKQALELHEALLGLGARAPDVEEPDVKGVVIGALTPPRRRLNAEEILEAMRGNEQLTTAVTRRSSRSRYPRRFALWCSVLTRKSSATSPGSRRRSPVRSGSSRPALRPAHRAGPRWRSVEARCGRRGASPASPQEAGT